MVKKFLSIFYKEFSGLHQAAFLLGTFALFSQVLALVRDRILAHNFGASTTLDLYYAAFRIPDFLFVSVASLVSITVLIPFIVKKADDFKNTRHFVDNVFTVFFLSIVAISGVIFLFIPALSHVLFPGFTDEAYSSLVIMTRILLLSPILLGLSNLFGSITQSANQFFVYALSPVLYNVGIIIGIVFFYPIMGMTGLVWGVVLGALFHLGVQVPAVVRTGLLPRPTLKLDLTEIKEVVLLSLPRTLGLSAKHLALLVLIGFASLMAEGSITVFNLSFNLQSVPLSIIGVSYSVAAFPTLARLFSKNNIQEFTRNILTATRHIIFWSMPIIVLFIVLRAQIVRTILGSGEFSWADTRLAAAALALFAISLVAQGLELLYVRGYYAAGRTKIPVIVNVFSALAIIGLSYALVALFETSAFFRNFTEALLRVEDIPGTKVLMLPLAYSIGTLLNTVILLVIFRRLFGAQPTTIRRVFWDSFATAVLMGFVAYQALQFLATVFDLNTFWGIFLQGLLAGLVGIIVGILVLKYVIGSNELNEVTRSLHTRFWKAKTVAPEKEEL